MDNQEDLLEYACGRFEAGFYDEALEAFVLAYAKGYEREWVLENICRCYLSPNEAEFRTAYESTCGGLLLPYEDCMLDFIPYQEGSYFVFDRELGLFRGKFSVAELADTPIPGHMAGHSFSDLALVLDWDWREALPALRGAKGREAYVVSADLPRILSFGKIPELSDYLEGIHVFKDYGEFQDYFHQDPSAYLPRILFGTTEEQGRFTKILDAEHAWRLTPEGRCTDNVLLTIAIPTHDRGNLLLERIENLKRMPYDAEIEVTISKNGTSLYQEEYEEASGIVAEDARFLYHDHGKELQYEQNWHYAMEMAHGRYVMFVSDEDDVIFEHLDYYLVLLRDHPEASMLRASGIGPNFMPLEKQVHAQKGFDAFCATFSRQNYLSGMIFRRKDFMEADLMSLLRFRMPEHRNEFYCCYPHEWWCASLVQVGDYIEEPLPLIIEEKAVKGTELSGQAKLPTYSTYGERLKQFQGELEFIRLFFGEQEGYWYAGLYKCIWKLFYLIKMARQYHYEPEHFLEAVSECAKRSMEAVLSAPITMKQQEMILKELEGYIAEAVELHKRLCAEETQSDS